MHVIVTGSRYLTDYDLLVDALDALDPTLVIHGGANGADALAGFWALDNLVSVQIYPANWARDGRRAGPIRNAIMLSQNQDATLLAFPRGGPGTAGCIRLAHEYRMRVVIS